MMDEIARKAVEGALRKLRDGRAFEREVKMPQ